MTYNKKPFGPVFTFILWLLVFLSICIVGISDVFGLETKTIYSNQTLDNSNQFNYGFVNSGGVDSITTGSVGSRISGKTKYINFYLSQNVALNYTYTIRINFLADDLQPYFSLNHIKEISVCNSSSCSNSSIISIKKQNNNGFSTWVELTFNPTQIGNVIGVTLGDNKGSFITGETFFGISSVQIESKNANQDVIDNATNNTNNIINNNNSNTESIINSNKETQEIIKDQFNTKNYCNNIVYNSYINKNYLEFYFDKSKISKNEFYMSFTTDDSLSGNSIYLCFGNDCTFITAITCDSNSLCSNSFSLKNDLYSSLINSTSTDNLHFRIYKNNASFTLLNNSFISNSLNSSNYCEYGSYTTTNKLDEANETSKGIFGKLKDLFNWLTNNDEADVSSAGDVAGWLPPGPIDSIINLPLTMLNNINSSLNKTCSPLEVNLPYVNKSVEIPCLNTIFNQITGLTNFWTWVGLISSVLILYRYLIELYKYYDRLTTLQANFISDWGGV